MHYIVHPGRSFLETDGSEGKGILIPAFEIGSEPTDILSTIYTTERPYVLVSIESTGNTNGDLKLINFLAWNFRISKYFVLKTALIEGNYWLVIVDQRKYYKILIIYYWEIICLPAVSNPLGIDIAFSVVVGLGAACCVVFAIYKLVLFSNARGRVSLEGIPQTCLTLHLVANISKSHCQVLIRLF